MEMTDMDNTWKVGADVWLQDLDALPQGTCVANPGEGWKPFYKSAGQAWWKLATVEVVELSEMIFPLQIISLPKG
jgi:hypothetical protein